MKTKWQTQSKIKLTRKELQEASPNSIIKKGTAYIEHPWFNQAKSVNNGGNLEEDNRSVKVKYVISRGGIVDWCIYHSLDANLDRSDFLQGTKHLEENFERIMRCGAKPHREEVIRAIVDCDDKTFKLYRH